VSQKRLFFLNNNEIQVIDEKCSLEQGATVDLKPQHSIELKQVKNPTETVASTVD